MVLQSQCLNQKKNTIDPENIINDYGADAVRLFILSDSPPAKDVQWSEQGMKSAYKFIQKFWIMHKKIVNLINSKSCKNKSWSISEFTNQLINKVTNNLEKFHYNVIIANFYETYNFLIKEIEKDINSDDLFINYSKILQIMHPVFPHITSECMEELNIIEKTNWPEINKKFLDKKNVNIIIQINGKKRGILNTQINLNEEKIMNEIKKYSKISQYITNKKITKSIFIKDRLINLIVK